MSVTADDGERSEIREELSKMTFEELQKLKEKLGSKVYNEAMFGAKKAPIKVFKRENKNRPREVSSRKAEPIILPKTKKPVVKDPRFDNMCGTFDDKRFRKDYGFLDEVKNKEKKTLVRQLKKTEDPDERRKVRSLLQRMKNKEMSEVKSRAKEEKKAKDLEEKLQSLKDGKMPYFRNKFENKVVNLVEQYTELKKKGKLQKHIEKHRKRLGQRDKKSGFFDDT